MTAKARRRPSATVGRNEVLRDSRGRVIDDKYVEGAVEDAIEYVRGRGRPSLSKSGESPLLRIRVSCDLDAAVRRAAGKSGESVPQWVRRALEHAVRQSS
jgi:predicted HicB family RNase H-like nuclease